ncbi:hypothetical protein Pyn_34548 [Prunus yedoensis var. nudiflora]|uniref:Uncharacterized protein n=1 Tax=Prunus yedoensis var. nudiflora TaxID=2094558 RepID=A0A314YK93_PRUYE|nr:hypothetical protein Pyn_34548 [Prunus yedoensis var. nudiflora]
MSPTPTVAAKPTTREDGHSLSGFFGYPSTTAAPRRVDETIARFQHRVQENVKEITSAEQNFLPKRSALGPCCGCEVA